MMISKQQIGILCCAILLASCSKKNFLEGTKRNVLKNNDALTTTIKPPVITPNSFLFVDVDKGIKDSVIKKIRMDLNPDILYYRSKSMLIPRDMPAINLATLKFVPAIAAPRMRGDIQGDKLLWISDETACLYGQTTGGEDIYMFAQYKDWGKITPDPNSPIYQARVKMSGQESVNESYRSLQSRKGADCWRIITFVKGSIMYQIMDYARKHGDNGKFFILTKGTSELDVCYFEHGKAFCCSEQTPNADIKVKDLANLMNYD